MHFPPSGLEAPLQNPLLPHWESSFAQGAKIFLHSETTNICYIFVLKLYFYKVMVLLPSATHGTTGFESSAIVVEVTVAMMNTKAIKY